MKEILLLAVALQVKHFVLDYALPANPDKRRLYQILDHAGLHGSVSALIGRFIAHAPPWRLVAVFFLDVAIRLAIVHFKAKPKCAAFLNDPKRQAFWHYISFEQLVHSLNHYAIISILLV